MSVWFGFGKAQGVGKKCGLVKTLVPNTDYSTGIIQGNPPGIIVTLAEFVKVDFAHVQFMSSNIQCVASGQILVEVMNYSNNTFLMSLATANNSGLSSLCGLSLSGESISGQSCFRCFAIGEGKRDKAT